MTNGVEKNSIVGNRARNSDLDVDSGWAWVVLVASFIVNAISVGTHFSLSVYYAEFVDYWDKGKELTAWLISLSCALLLSTGPFASILANRFSYRVVIIAGSIITASGFFLSAFVQEFGWLFLTFGFMTGFGSGLSYAPSFGVLPLYFKKRRNFATALVTAGNGFGIIIFSALFRYLITTYSWRGAMFINAGLALNIIPCGAVIFKKQPRIAGGGFSQFAEFTLFREPAFYFSLVHFFLMGANYIFVVLCIQYAKEKVHVSPEEAPALLMVNGFTNLAGRAFSALISTNPKIGSTRNRFILLHLFSIAVALAIAAYPLCETFTAICVVSGMVGFTWGAKFALVPGLQIDILSAPRFNAAWGYLVFLLGLAFLLFPPFGSYIGKATGSFDNAFYFSGAISGVAFIFCLVLHYLMYKRSKAQSSNDLELSKPHDENIRT